MHVSINKCVDTCCDFCSSLFLVYFVYNLVINVHVNTENICLFLLFRRSTTDPGLPIRLHAVETFILNPAPFAVRRFSQTQTVGRSSHRLTLEVNMDGVRRKDGLPSCSEEPWILSSILAVDVNCCWPPDDLDLDLDLAPAGRVRRVADTPWFLLSSSADNILDKDNSSGCRIPAAFSTTGQVS